MLTKVTIPSSFALRSSCRPDSKAKVAVEGEPSDKVCQAADAPAGFKSGAWKHDDFPVSRNEGEKVTYRQKTIRRQCLWLTIISIHLQHFCTHCNIFPCLYFVSLFLIYFNNISYRGFWFMKFWNHFKSPATSHRSPRSLCTSLWWCVRMYYYYNLHKVRHCTFVSPCCSPTELLHYPSLFPVCLGTHVFFFLHSHTVNCGVIAQSAVIKCRPGNIHVCMFRTCP